MGVTNTHAGRIHSTYLVIALIYTTLEPKRFICPAYVTNKSKVKDIGTRKRIYLQRNSEDVDLYFSRSFILLPVMSHLLPSLRFGYQFVRVLFHVAVAKMTSAHSQARF